jgi:hypothetical protein
MKAGILDDIDFLGQIVAGEHIPRGEGQPPSQVKASVTEQMQELVQNKEGLVKAMDLMDKVLEYVVIEPRISRPVRRDDAGKPLLEPDPKNDGKPREIPLPDEEKAPGVIYTDMVDLVDKSFIFQFVVGGTADLATFRKEHEEALGSLATVSAVPDEAI